MSQNLCRKRITPLDTCQSCTNHTHNKYVYMYSATTLIPAYMCILKLTLKKSRGTHVGFSPMPTLDLVALYDIFFIWTSDEESLTRFIDHMNSFHTTIKFTSEYSTTETHFLDVVIRKEENGLTTDLFVKPTDKHQYLHSTSCHPRHCKTSIAYSQALRRRQICSNDSDFLHHSQVLKTHLVSRGHSSQAVHQAIKNVKSMPWLSVLSEKPTTHDCANKKIPLVVIYHPSLPPIRQITSANHHILHTSDRLQCAIPEEPMIAFRCPPSLRNLLIRAEDPPTNDSSIPPIQHGMFRCTSRCVTCQEHILESDSFKSHTTGAHHKIRVPTLPVPLLT